MEQDVGIPRESYRIPWSPVVLSTLIFLFFLTFLIVLGICPIITGMYRDYPYIAYLSLFLFFIFVLVSFIKLQFCINMIDYPLKKWVIDNIKCPRCGSIFTKCEANMRNPLSFATFIVYCNICGRFDIIETGMFDKTLRFAPIDREITSRHEKKYLGEAYKLPWIVWLSDIFLTLIITLTGVCIAISPVILYIYFYGRPNDHDVIFFFLTLVTLVFMFYIKCRDMKIGHFASRHTIWRWVLKNIKCPECGNAFTKCDVEPKDLDLEVIVHCTYCKRDRLIELEPPDLLLIYDNYLFSWNNVPGTDSKKLLRFLRENCLNMAWVEKAEIHKSDDNKTIHISKDENSGEIMIDEGGGIILKIGDFTSTTYLRVKKENGNLDIYVNK